VNKLKPQAQSPSNVELSAWVFSTHGVNPFWILYRSDQTGSPLSRGAYPRNPRYTSFACVILHLYWERCVYDTEYLPQCQPQFSTNGGNSFRISLSKQDTTRYNVLYAGTFVFL